jgi:hypothetical protein
MLLDRTWIPAFAEMTWIPAFAEMTWIPAFAEMTWEGIPHGGVSVGVFSGPRS